MTTASLLLPPDNDPISTRPCKQLGANLIDFDLTMMMTTLWFISLTDYKVVQKIQSVFDQVMMKV